MLGDGLVSVTAESDLLRLGLAMDGFVELRNFTRDQPVPWQSFRANVGFEILVGSPSLSRTLLPARGSLQLGVGWFHESDHVAALEAYEIDFLTPARVGSLQVTPALDNGNFSSFEYVKLRAIYRQPVLDDKLTLQFVLGPDSSRHRSTRSQYGRSA